jgi:hypothetical protein
MSFSVKILEDTATQMLKSVSENLQAKVHERILNVGHAWIVPYSQSICPVDTGYLRSTIFFEPVGILEFSFGASADYAMPVELGHMSRGGRFIPPQSFIRPAIETYYPQILEAVVQAVMEACKG